jgi:tRNA pseudouridine38-40 synthase
MERYQVILAYDGTRYKGFQRQSRSVDEVTVQGVVEVALRKLGWQGKHILSSGRTDTGVHATGQVIAFDLDWLHTTEALQAALNAQLPNDVAVLQLKLVERDFHPRYDAKYRTYRYHLFCHPVRQPLLERYAWRVWPPIDRVILNESARLLIGRHDFAAFGRTSKAGASTVREVFVARWSPNGLDGETTGWDFLISANGFLYRMVRRLVDYQVSIARGKYRIDDLESLLQNPPEHPVQALAPPRGLILQDVCYLEGQ